MQPPRPPSSDSSPGGGGRSAFEIAEAAREFLWARGEGPSLQVRGFRSDQAPHMEAQGWRRATQEEVVAHTRRFFVVHQPTGARHHQALPDLSGKTAWVIGSGPTTGDVDTSLLEGRLTLALNRELRTFHEPTFAVIADQRVAGITHVLSDPGFADMAVRLSRYREAGGSLVTAEALTGPMINAWPRSRCFRFRRGGHTGWSNDPAFGYFPGYTVAMLALQFLSWCGCRRANLVGVDLCHAPDGRTHHFGRVPRNIAADPRNMACMRACFEIAGEEWERLGFDVVSCSRYGEIAGTRHVPFEDALAEEDG